MSHLKPSWTRKLSLLSPEALQCIVTLCRISRSQPRVLRSKATRSHYETGAFLQLVDVQSAKNRLSHAYSDTVAIVWQYFYLQVYLGSDFSPAKGHIVLGLFTFHRWPLQARVEVIGKVVKRGRHGRSQAVPS